MNNHGMCGASKSLSFFWELLETNVLLSPEIQRQPAPITLKQTSEPAVASAYVPVEFYASKEFSVSNKVQEHILLTRRYFCCALSCLEGLGVSGNAFDEGSARAFMELRPHFLRQEDLKTDAAVFDENDDRLFCGPDGLEEVEKYWINAISSASC